MRIFVFIVLFFLYADAVYLSNKSCKECHKAIFEEYEHSYHSKGYFNDILHRKVADTISTKKYDCAVCHMPAATNINNLVEGKIRPNEKDVRESDAVSCFFCHEIAYVKKSHRFNINVPTKQIEGYKPSLYGSLQNPDENDKHSSLHNPLYDKNVCKGCHSHKRNENDLLIFETMKDNETSKECIKCHMPYIPGGNENMNKRARTKHRSHYFPGIHDPEMREKAVGLKLTIKENHNIIVSLKNKMPHSLIVQPAREMYLRVKLTRGDKTLWSNKNDKNAYFKYEYLKNNKEVVIPYSATKYKWKNNLDGNATKIFDYSVKGLKKGDKITASFYMIVAKKSCLRAINLKGSDLDRPLLAERVEKIVK